MNKNRSQEARFVLHKWSELDGTLFMMEIVAMTTGTAHAKLYKFTWSFDRGRPSERGDLDN